MDSYKDNTIQTKKERNSVKNLEIFLHISSSTDSLYSSFYWDMKWDIKRENLVPIKHQYSLDDLYLYNDYDNVIRNEYER